MAGRHGRVPTSFCVVLSCVGTGLATGLSPVQGILPNVDELSENLTYVRRPRFSKNSKVTGKGIINRKVT